MANYLSKFQSTLGKNQYERLARSLNKQKLAGGFSTAAAFKKKLEQLMADLFSQKIEPLFKAFYGIAGGRTDSETYNFMLERAQDDLETAFDEAIKIDEVLQGHHAVMRDVVLKSLKHSLASLEDEVAAYEFMASAGQGFNAYLSSNFSGIGGTRLQRGTEYDKFFMDPRTGESLATSKDVFLDQVGKFIVLPNRASRYISPIDIECVFDDEAIFTDRDVEPEGVNLNNIIDGTEGTFWIRSYMFESKPSKISTNTVTSGIPTEVQTKLKFIFGGVAEVNFLEVEPALANEVLLSSFEYVDASGETIVVGDVSQLIHQHREKVYFRKIAAKTITLTFVNATSYPVSYEIEEDNVLLSDVLPQQVVEIIGENSTKEKINFAGRQFVIGFDNIKFGLTTFGETGVFVSRALSLSEKNAQSLGLRVSESRPASEFATIDTAEYVEDTYDDLDTKIFYGSVEYWAMRRLYSVSGALIATDLFPILPLNVTRVNNERLILTHKYSDASVTNDSGKLMFYTTISEGDIKVYRNGSLTPLTYNVDWVEETALSQTSANVAQPMAFGVRVSSPAVGDIYTISYDPVVSNIKTKIAAEGSTHHRLVDLVGDLSCRSYTDQLVVMDGAKAGSLVSSMEINFIILLRRNTQNPYLSPIVDSFICAVGSQNPEKFAGGFNV